ncbi:MAG: DUF4783 domain-containing protein [Lewinellaceae bacterium]|nr:DUF4783 domain-containing protein [Lewinellaceae bacterium]
MKNLLFLLLFAPALAFGYQGNPNLDAITQALSSGDVETLSKYFADNVEISIKDNEQLYPKAKATSGAQLFKQQAQVVPAGTKGTSRENSDRYCIGNLSATNGSYRVYLYLKASGNTLKIQEIRFDEE